ncbi:MFS transporter [Mesorhizobium atlanticum]
MFSKLVFPTPRSAGRDALLLRHLRAGLYRALRSARCCLCAIDRAYGRGAKLTIALFLLGTSTVAMAFLPSYEDVGAVAAWLLALTRFLQGLALGGTWDGLPSLLALNAPQNRRGIYAMIPQLGAPIGLIVASSLFAFFVANLSADDFFAWGWRYPFFVAFAINVVALFARLRIVVTPEFSKLSRER